MSTPIDELYDRMPHVDREWARQAVMELALLDVNGANIGAAMLEVESHMAEHGGDVGEVFGDPRAYAAALELPGTERLSGPQWAGVWLPAVLLFTGMSVLLDGVLVPLGGGGLSILSVGLVLLVLVVAAIAVVRFELLRFMVQHPVVSGVVLAAVVGSVGVLASLVPGPTLDLAPAVSLAAGAVLLGAGTVLLARLRRRSRDDGIRFPSA